VLVTDLIDTTRARLQQLRVRSVEQVRSHPTRLIRLSSRLERENKRLKEFLQKNLYAHREVSFERKNIVTCLERLFRYFVENPGRLPHSFVARNRHEPTHRVVCDYIAGMTDNYLMEQYRIHVGK
jgi:dGTPase